MKLISGKLQLKDRKKIAKN